jgi:hypothetical protein
VVYEATDAVQLMAGLSDASVTEIVLRAHVVVGPTEWTRAQLNEGGVELNHRELTLMGDVAACSECLACGSAFGRPQHLNAPAP